MKAKRIFLFLLALTTTISYAVQTINTKPETGHYLVSFPYGTIDWSTGVVLVNGTAEIPQVLKNPDDFHYQSGDYNQPRSLPQARLLAKNKAKENALNNAEKIFMGIRIDSKTILKDYMENPVINGKVNSFINDPLKIKSVETFSNKYRITLEYALFGPKSLLALNNEPDFDDNFVNCYYEKYPAKGQTNIAFWEGLVVSAHYLQPAVALNPKIYAENGRLVYDSSLVYGDEAAQTGLVLYAKKPFGLTKPVNVRFFHSRAVNTAGFGSADIVISDEDADAILSSAKTLENLRKCKVIILAPDKR